MNLVSIHSETWVLIRLLLWNLNAKALKYEILFDNEEFEHHLVSRIQLPYQPAFADGHHIAVAH